LASWILHDFRQKRQEVEQRREAVDDACGDAFGRVAPVAWLYCLLLFFFLSMVEKTAALRYCTAVKVKVATVLSLYCLY
jgi:hypothetical protein